MPYWLIYLEVTLKRSNDWFWLLYYKDSFRLNDDDQYDKLVPTLRTHLLPPSAGYCCSSPRLRNVNNYLRNYTTAHPSKCQPSQSPMCEISNPTKLYNFVAEKKGENPEIIFWSWSTCKVGLLSTIIGTRDMVKHFTVLKMEALLSFATHEVHTQRHGVIQLAFLLFIVCTIFLSSFTLCNTSSFITRSVQLIFSILLQHHISKLSRYFWSTFPSVQVYIRYSNKNRNYDIQDSVLLGYCAASLWGVVVQCFNTAL
jgi:hypothetical protein